jgi:hypothetical protein
VEAATDLHVEDHLPWYLDCNRDRFPYWFGQPDPRNWDLLQHFPALAHSVRTVPQTYAVQSPVQRVFAKDYNVDLNNHEQCITITYFQYGGKVV